MSDLLKGNFQTKNKIESQAKAADSLEDRFEKEAMKRLGGSIAYVAKKKILWDRKKDGE